jgi:carboxymethylenebutenolidase
MKIASERINVRVGTATMPAYVAKPQDEGKWPGVLLFMEIFGINHHIRSVADRVAGEGYVVLAPDFFHRTAPGIELGYDAEGLQKGIGLMTQVKA